MTGKTRQTLIESPLGPLCLESDGHSLTAIRFAPRGEPPVFRHRVSAAGPFREVIGQLGAYFRGELREFDLPLAPAGTRFQLAAWECLRRIPYGQTVTYAEQAARMGRPGAARAVGSANARNPLPIVIPCHRVVGGDGTLTGYAGGLGLKRLLLQLEGAI